MSWIILWLVLSVPAALLIGSIVAVGNRRVTDSESPDHPGPEMHDQTIVG